MAAESPNGINPNVDRGQETTIDQKLNILCRQMAEMREGLEGGLDKLGSDIVSTIQMASSTLNLHAEMLAQQQRERDAMFGEDKKDWACDLHAGRVEGPFRRQVPTNIGSQYQRKAW